MGGGTNVDIAGLSIVMNHASLKQMAALATVKQAMNTATTNAAGLVDMLQQTQAIQQSAEPHLGGNIDIKF